MSEMNENANAIETNGTEEGMNLPENPNVSDGAEMVASGGIGGLIGGFVGSKIGYNNAIKDVAKLTGVDPKELAASVKAAKKDAKKGKKGKLHFRNPFYREEVVNAEPDKKQIEEAEPEKEDEVKKEEQKPKKNTKK